MTHTDTATDDLWDRLRAQLDALVDANSQKTDPEAVAKRLSERAATLRSRSSGGKAAGPRLSFLTFHHGNQRYGILVEDIIEILPLRDYTPVPATPPFIVGVIHWRGAIISLFDLVALFAIPETGLSDEKTCLIVDLAGTCVGIMAGIIDDLVTVPMETVKPAPDLRYAVPQECIVGVYDENCLVLRIAQVGQDARLTEWRNGLAGGPTSND